MGYINQHGGVDDTGSMSGVGLLGGFVNTPAGGGGGTAPGATLTGTATFTGGAATGGGSGTAPGATLAGTATFTGGAAIGGGGAGTLTTRIQVFNTGTVRANETGVTLFVWNPTTGALVVKLTGQTTDSQGRVVATDAALASGTSYSYDVLFSDGGRKNIAKAAA